MVDVERSACAALSGAPRSRALPIWGALMEKVVAPKIYFRTCIALLALLALTWTIGYIDLGPFNLIVALAVSITKAIVIALFFMHIKGSSRLLHLAAVADVMWLLILIFLTLGDYFTRGWVPLDH